MISSTNDTIAAIATPVGEGGISIIRISGPAAFDVADECFHGKQHLSDCPSHTIHHGSLRDGSGNTIDHVLALVYRAPKSYTGENTVEFSCHGGIFVTRRVLEEVLRRGARLAEPGEFSKRAFLNGKLDLSQAEAIADLIQSQSERSHQASINQLRRGLSSEIDILQSKLIETIGLLELELDFVEDGYSFVDKPRLQEQIESALVSISKLIETYSYGRVFREGVKVVLAGAPNVGKSSLMNRMLNENRAIVTSIPGTTRDSIEESLNIDGFLFRLTDTAGIRDTTDAVEHEGVQRTKQEASESDLLLVVLDASRPIASWEKNILTDLLKGKKNCLFLLNKIDLNPNINGYASEIVKGRPTIKTSAVTGEGLDELRKMMANTVSSGGSKGPEGSVSVTNVRHYEALRKAHGSLGLALESVEKGVSNEFAALDLRAALDSLGEITGAVTTDEILNSIFSRFCIGK